MRPLRFPPKKHNHLILFNFFKIITFADFWHNFFFSGYYSNPITYIVSCYIA